MINTEKIKKDFPIFTHNPGLVYLDSTATSLKPRQVIDKITEYYSQYSANIFRGVYKISEKATEEYESAREAVARFIGGESREIVFTRNATESLNLVAYSIGRKVISQGDEIVTTVMEHHSNFVPWQVLSGESGTVFKVIDIDANGYLQTDLNQVITRRTKILALTMVSNVLGTINPVREIIVRARKINPKLIVVVDAAQAVPHMKIDVKSIGADFVAFSSHKMLGPTGVGVLWGKYQLLKEMFPFLYGGEMISEVHLDYSLFKEPPYKFEAGTPSIGEVIALKEAVDYLGEVGMNEIRAHEEEITGYAIEKITESFGDRIKIFGPSNIKDKGGILAFTFGSFHAHDIASILDEEGIAVRAGHHCAMPLHERLALPSTVRASFYIYNDRDDVDKLIEGLKKVERTL